MTNSEHPSPPPTLTLVEKLYAVHNINSLIPKKLDLTESNYSTWSYFFKGHCSNFGVLKYIEEPVTEASTLIKANPKTAKAAWDAIETIFQDNKRTRTISLKGELRVIQMGDQTADEYFSKIEAILTLLTDLGSDMSDDDVVTYAINGLSDKYGSLAQIIAHKDPFPDLANVRSMVETEELRLRSRSSVLPPTALLQVLPQVLLAEASSRTPRKSNNSTTHRTTQGTLPVHAGSQSGGLNVSQQQQLLQLLQAQQTMLAQFGFSIGLIRPISSAYNSTQLPVWSTAGPTSLQPTNNQAFSSGNCTRLCLLQLGKRANWGTRASRGKRVSMGEWVSRGKWVDKLGSVGSVASTSTGVGESNEVGESSGGQAVELRWVNDKSRDHMEKYQESMVESHGENVESHPHNEEPWNKVTPPNRGNTFGAYNASDHVFLFTGTPSTRNASTSHPQIKKVR
ncbi:hybrid signal transduction histidine kinase M [Tanacetum coccineum]